MTAYELAIDPITAWTRFVADQNLAMSILELPQYALQRRCVAVDLPPVPDFGTTDRVRNRDRDLVLVDVHSHVCAKNFEVH